MAHGRLRIDGCGGLHGDGGGAEPVQDTIGPPARLFVFFGAAAPACARLCGLLRINVDRFAGGRGRGRLAFFFFEVSMMLVYGWKNLAWTSEYYNSREVV
ncbi:hypothetical protein PLESTB_000579400 [Pleodorina starrii]|uniref:Uncharacterized protein n=1 Tax=Pleodorina starrii TaxID=330485 RepID=A0A9W6BHT6_9CHLO|nr:hypothetical protein PLESTM_000305400 [Pleodorina starrii]GLC52070.1 hypothetical protein PLESTB_000579400 [Pleodorina starrii]GLC72211.1 hypothetical protein PLESTF_001219400 [Pleodorina starrii]